MQVIRCLYKRQVHIIYQVYVCGRSSVCFSGCMRKWYSALEDGQARIWQLEMCKVERLLKRKWEVESLQIPSFDNKSCEVIPSNHPFLHCSLPLLVLCAQSYEVTDEHRRERRSN